VVIPVLYYALYRRRMEPRAEADESHLTAATS
jgi:hypothetical protein